MKFAAIFLCALSFALPAYADLAGQGISPTSPPPAAEPTAPNKHHDYGMMIEAGYGFESVSPKAMNNALNDFQWPNSDYVKGPINSMQYYDFAFGYRIFHDIYLVVRYEQAQYAMLPVSVGSPVQYSVTNEFDYNPIFLLVDIPVYRYANFFVTAVGGVGYALKYELHQTENPGEDITWRANPMVYRVGTTVGYSFSENFDIVADISLDSVSSELRSAKNYNTLYNGSPIAGDQYFTDQNSGSVVNVNMSGLRYGISVKGRF